MAAISITPANVGVGSDTVTKRVRFGETVTQGEVVYKKSDDSRYWLADSSTATLAAAEGIALTGGGAGEYGLIAKSGDIDIGGTVAVGAVYTVGSVSGEIHPDSDLGSGEYLTILGYGKTTSTILIDINATEIAHA